MKRGHLIIVSAPSGSGKSTIINEIIKDESLRLQFSISATNRPPRRGEADGVNYYFHYFFTISPKKLVKSLQGKEIKFS